MSEASRLFQETQTCPINEYVLTNLLAIMVKGLEDTAFFPLPKPRLVIPEPEIDCILERPETPYSKQVVKHIAKCNLQYSEGCITANEMINSILNFYLSVQDEIIKEYEMEQKAYILMRVGRKLN